MKNFFVLIATLLTLFISGITMAAGNAADGKNKAAACAGCHGIDGNSAIPNYPSLAGQHENYIVKQLKDFKSGNRASTVMSTQVQTLTEPVMADMAAFYASLPPKATKVDKKLALEGEKFYRAGNSATGVSACGGCHGPTGKGMPGAGFPALTGQNAAYTESQLNAFRNSTRINDIGKMMQGISAKMSDQEIKAVSAYISGLQ